MRVRRRDGPELTQSGHEAAHWFNVNVISAVGTGMPTLQWTPLGWMILFIGTVLFGCSNHLPPTSLNTPFSIRIADESTDVPTRPASADLVPNFKDGGSVWLKREGAIEGPFVVEAHTGSVEGESVVLFTLTPEAADRFASLTRANVGHRVAMVVDGKVVLNTLIAGEAPRTSLQFSGNFTEAQARAIAAKMMRASPSR